ncbi:MAG TPA: alpha/beta hydrolase [Rhizomicrobium sp.]|jgi:pimeloyl-ACP methyl ester carboxylesterase|nr:alpha/beta hydrolase [Rhizomicrobium sp.]
MLLRLALPLFALVIAVAAIAAPVSTDPYTPGRSVVSEIDHIVTPRGVDDTFIATLGGAREVVNVRGADRGNPILIYVHGGPGSVEMPMAWAFQRPWEDYFTVVQWDQRGAGRSYLLNDPKKLAPTMNLGRYRDDAIELIEQLRKRYGKRKVFLLGHSWGSAVGLSVAIKRPDLLYAYIGMGQAIDFVENERVGYAWTLDTARKNNNAKAVHALEAIAPYPGKNGALMLDKTNIERQWSVYYGALAANRHDADFYYHAARLSPLYTAADRKAWDDGSAFTIKTLWPQLAHVSFEAVNKINVPVILFLGRHDYTCPWPIAEAWMKRLTAPKKDVVWFDNSAHLPMIEEPGRVFAALLQKVRPLATPSN